MWITRLKSWILGALLCLTTASAFGQDTPQNYDSAYANGNAPYSNAAPAQHRPFFPLNPVGFVMPATPFAPANISDYDLGPKPRLGYFFSYDRLIWMPNKPPATTIGSRAAEGIYLENGVATFETNTTTTSALNANIGWGNRWEFGYMDTNDYGWLVSVLDHVAQFQTLSINNAQVLLNDPSNRLFGFSDYDGSGFDDDNNGNSVFGRDGIDTTAPRDFIPDAAAPPDLGDQTKLFPRFGILDITNHTILNGVEIMRMYRAPRLHNGGTFDLLYGVRYLQIDDRFNLTGRPRFYIPSIDMPSAPSGDGVIGLASYSSPIDNMWIDTRIVNNIVGPQIGGAWRHQRGRWILNCEARFLAGANMQNGKQQVQVATNANSFGTFISPVDVPTIVDNGDGTTSITQTQEIGAVPQSNRPAPLNVAPTGVITTNYHTAFSPTGELRLNSTYQLTQSFGLRFGYTATYIGNVSRAANRVNYTFPYFGFNDSSPDQHLFVHGLNFGLEFNR